MWLNNLFFICIWIMFMVGMIGAAYYLSYIVSFSGFPRLLRTFSYGFFNSSSTACSTDVDELYRRQFLKYFALMMISVVIGGIATYVSIQLNMMQINWLPAWP